MEKAVLENVRFGVLDANNKFVMSPPMKNIKIYAHGKHQNGFKNDCFFEVFDYQLDEQGDSLNIYVTDTSGNVYSVDGFAKTYIQYLNIYNCNIVTLIIACKEQHKPYSTLSKILDLSIVTKIQGNEVFVPPIDCFKKIAKGYIIGHKYLGNGLNKTSKITNICFAGNMITSKRTTYIVRNMCKEYEQYLVETLSDVETILEYHF